MQLQEFDYNLPQELIATKPLKTRSASKMMHLDKQSNTIKHKNFSDIVDILNTGDLLIMNDTKVIPARLFGKKETGGNIEILITTILDKYNAMAMLKSNSKIKTPLKIVLDSSIVLDVITRDDASFKISMPKPVLEILNTYGRIPIPPYMQRLDDHDDKQRYQTVYAEKPGAVAAPTAGLHFDENIITKLKAKGVVIETVTLHVGIGTFQNVKCENIKDHKMHSEYFEVTKECAQAWQQAKANGNRVVAVGTTSVRSLESAWDGVKVSPKTGDTDIFITPGYKFNAIDALITNFHLPKSTLIMLICALGGYDFIMQAYREAVEKEYRFFSYGDAMFIE
jgi:S-adenosylmethionine:tRNA ribosyltransferase-isomerase